MTHSTDATPTRVVIVGAGFAGMHAARRLARLAGHQVEVTLINPTDYFLYLPLLPEVTAGVLDPRRVAVSLRTACPGARLLLGTVDRVDLASRRVEFTDPEGSRQAAAYDRLLLTAGSVNKLLPIPGVARYAHGFRSIAEALYLRDHLLRQLELAEACEDPAERQARCTFVVVGAGYTGTEVAAHGQLLTRDLARGRDGLRDQQIRWLLIDRSADVLAELSPRLAETAHRTLTRRGVDIRTRTTIVEATRDGVPAVHRRVRACPDADLVRRGTSRPADRVPRAAHGQRPADRGRVPERARSSRGIQLR